MHKKEKIPAVKIINFGTKKAGSVLLEVQVVENTAGVMLQMTKMPKDNTLKIGQEPDDNFNVVVKNISDLKGDTILHFTQSESIDALINVLTACKQYLRHEKCTHCFKTVVSSDKFCKHCGQKL